MNLKRFALVLLLGITASVGYCASFAESAALAPNDDAAAGSQITFGFDNPNTRIPGGNVVDGVSAGNLPNIAAVPEPSAAVLAGLGILGIAALKYRRRAR